MKRTIGLISILGLGFIQLSYGLDKEHLKQHIVKALSWPQDLIMQVEDPVPSSVTGIQQVTINIGEGDKIQQQTVLYSPDTNKYIVGAVFDLSVDPDMERMKKINLKGVHSKGSNKAPVTIVEFSDLQCGYCAKAHNAFEANLYKKYSKKDVRIVFKHFPLNFHKWAEEGSVATECAGEQGNKGFWGMTDLFFKNASSVTPENVREKAMEYAGELKLNRRKLQRCMDGDKARARVIADRKEGSLVGVSSTPTFFINGRMKRGFRTFEDFQTYIDDKLAEAKKK